MRTKNRILRFVLRVAIFGITGIAPHFSYFFIFSPSFTVAQEAEAAASPRPKEQNAENNTGLTIEGLYLGNIVSIDPKGRFLFLAPEVDGLKRKVFYLDKRTRIRKDRQVFPRKSLEEGQRVAVRYFGEDSLLVADAVFIVEDEFNLPDYNLPRR